MSDEEILTILKFHRLSLSINDFSKLVPYITIDEVKIDEYNNNILKMHIISKEGNKIKCWVNIIDVEKV